MTKTEKLTVITTGMSIEALPPNATRFENICDAFHEYSSISQLGKAF